MSAGRYDFTITQGAAFNRTIVWNTAAGTPVDNTNYTAQLIAKGRLTDSTEVFNISTPSDNLANNGLDGSTTISFSQAETTAMDFYNIRYDLFQDDIHLLTGTISLERTTRNG